MTQARKLTELFSIRDEDGVGAAFGLGVGFGGDGFDFEAGFGEAFGKGVIGAG